MRPQTPWRLILFVNPYIDRLMGWFMRSGCLILAVALGMAFACWTIVFLLLEGR